MWLCCSGSLIDGLWWSLFLSVLGNLQLIRFVIKGDSNQDLLQEPILFCVRVCRASCITLDATPVQPWCTWLVLVSKFFFEGGRVSARGRQLKMIQRLISISLSL